MTEEEFGVQHPGGMVSVRVDGWPFTYRGAAEEFRDLCDVDCDECDGGTHVVVVRTVTRTPWRPDAG